MPVQFLHATANRPGAIAIVQLVGDSRTILQALTGVKQWPLHHVRFVNFAGIDEGLAVRLTEHLTQLMPHGGLRVMQRLTARLIELGAEDVSDLNDSTLDPLLLYPEATDRFEALTLLALSHAASPLAIDLLLDQPRRWRESYERTNDFHPTANDNARSRRLNRLIHPPVVVLAGKPNVGKSTLSNALLGRAMSIAYDMPGTTRDYTAGRIELAGLVVNWHDTPGIRQTDDPIEAKAVELATRLIDRADLLIAMADPQSPWPQLPREPDLRVMNKIDLPQNEKVVDFIAISAHTGQGISTLVAAVRDRLVPPADLEHPGVWQFDNRLMRV